jgi:hypothetical protein
LVLFITGERSIKKLVATTAEPVMETASDIETATLYFCIITMAISGYTSRH